VSNSPNRSFEKIAIADLERLRDLALGYFDDLFMRKPNGSGRLRGHLILLCLVQGGARHFVYQDRGVRDFDVLGLFRSIPETKYNPQHMKSLDFGPSKVRGAKVLASADLAIGCGCGRMTQGDCDGFSNQLFSDLLWECRRPRTSTPFPLPISRAWC
jgi:hypothetical protein